MDVEKSPGLTVEDWLGEKNLVGIDIWKNKYQERLYEDEEVELENGTKEKRKKLIFAETFEDWLDRVSNGNKDLRDAIFNKYLLFGGRILANRGLDKYGLKVTYSNCYVLDPPKDNIASIWDCARDMAITFSKGGGVGIDISNLAPSGARVNNTAKYTSGAISFMDLYSLTTGLIGQNGRRGALMISIDCHHPDIEHFIELKSNLDKVTKANISVRVTEDFMEAVKNDLDFKLSFFRPETNETIEKTVKARYLFEKLCYMNWDFAEPGMLFWDRISKWNLLSNNPDFSYAGTNPCAEEPLPNGGSCNLSSINLSRFVGKDRKFDFEKFKEIIRIAIDGLDDVLTQGCELHPLESQVESVKDWRQVGLGIMGLADMLIKLNLRFGSKESIEFCDKLGKILIETAVDESAELARKYGTYRKYDSRVLDTDFFKYNVTDEAIIQKVKQYGLRNSQLLTCAPTGSLSTMLGISGGIEPIFANSYTRKTESLKGKDEYYKIYTPIVEEYMRAHKIKDERDLPSWFVTASSISVEERVAMQSIWQKHIDASISSTVNIPNSASVDDVKEIYLDAYEQGLKGITVYRAGCKREGILVQEQEMDPKTGESVVYDYSKLPWGTVLKTSEDHDGKMKLISCPCGDFWFQMWCDKVDGRPWETFIEFVDNQTPRCSFLNACSRFLSKGLRAGVSPYEYADSLMKTPFCETYKDKIGCEGSCTHLIGKAILEFLDEIQDNYLDEEDDFEDLDEEESEVQEVEEQPGLCKT